jgi:hypothetical protein
VPDRVLVLDTSVWRPAARDRGWLRRAADAGERIAAPCEAVQELVVAGLTGGPRAFEECRLACRLVDRYADTALAPVVWHLAAEAGIPAPAPPDPRLACQAVAAAPSREHLRNASLRPWWAGGAWVARPGAWARGALEEKEAWRRSVLGAVEEHWPGVCAARASGRRVPLAAHEYAAMRESLAGVDPLVRVEYVRTFRTLGVAPLGDAAEPDALAALRGALEVFVLVFREAVLDLFDGPHNAAAPKIRFEPNDAWDLAQLRYAQGPRVWVTLDRRWRALAARAGVPDRVRGPEEVAGGRPA